MKILIAYATSEGQTRKIAGYIASRLGADGHEVTTYDSASTLGDTDLNAFGAIFVAGSVHDHEHQEAIIDFAIAHRDTLNATPSAFLSVSLAAAMKNGVQDAQSYVDGFVEETGWRPADVLLVAGALRQSEYDYFRQQIIKSIVAERDDRLDPERDCEFTDWNAVASFVWSVVEKAKR